MKASRTAESLLQNRKKHLISRSPSAGQSLLLLTLTAAAFCCHTWSLRLIVTADLSLSALAATLPSRSRIRTATLLPSGRSPRGHPGSLLHEIIGVDHDDVAILQSSGDVHLRTQVPPHMHGPHLDDVVLYYRHKLTAGRRKQAVARDQDARARSLVMHLRGGEHAGPQAVQGICY